MFEILLLSVVLTTGFLGPAILRRYGPQQRVYGFMLIADMVLALLAFGSRMQEGPNATSNAVGAVAIGAAFCLVMLPPMLRDFGRRMMAADKLRIARLLVEIREMLQPGMGARAEAELLETVMAVRQGREDEVVRNLEKRRVDADEFGARLLDERIIMTYLYAQRWDQAVLRYERTVQRGQRPTSPQLNVEMVRAYCENRDMDKAAELLKQIEESPLVAEPLLEGLFARSRLVFLAFAGRTGVVESMISKGPLSQMPQAARSYWSGIARLHAGDMLGAKSSFREAADLSKKDERAKALAETRLKQAESGEFLGVSVSTEVGGLADSLTSSLQKQAKERDSRPEAQSAGKRLPSLGSIPLREMPVTAILSLAILLVAYWVYRSFGTSTDLGGLIASGANLKSATQNGEWWRLGSSMFLHVGLTHLALNVYGLWVLGRLVEQMQGSVRTLAIYLGSGIIAGLASTFLGGSATAVGASGAVLGLMGAAVSELAVFRKHYPPRWARPLLRVLIILSLAQIAIGFVYPIVDQWGHVGGMLGGALLGVLLSRQMGIPGLLKQAVALIFGAAGLAFLVYAGIHTVGNDYGESMAAYPRVSARMDGLELEVPSAWRQAPSHELFDPGISSIFDIKRIPAEVGLDAAIAARLNSEHQGGALEAGFDQARPAAQSAMDLPQPWRGGELEVKVDGSGGQQEFRLVVFGRVAGDEIWVGAFYHPAALTQAMGKEFSRLLSSIRLISESEKLE